MWWSCKLFILILIIEWVFLSSCFLFATLCSLLLCLQIGFLKKVNLIFLFVLLWNLIPPFYLFIHCFLRHPSNDYVFSISSISILGHMLHACYTSCAEIIPFHCSISSLWKHNVYNKIQCHDLWALPTWQRLWMGGDKKFNSMISGPFQLGSACEWVVTKNMGRSSEADSVAFMEKETCPQLEYPKYH